MRAWREESEQRLASELAQARQQLIIALTAAKSARSQKQFKKKLKEKISTVSSDIGFL